MVSKQVSAAKWCLISLILYLSWFSEGILEVNPFLYACTIAATVLVIWDAASAEKHLLPMFRSFFRVPYRMLWMFAIFSAYALVSGIFVAPDKDLFWDEIITFLSFLVLYYDICYVSFKSDSVKWIGAVFVLSALICSFQLLIAPQVYREQTEMLSLGQENNPNTLAVLLVFAMFFIAASEKNIRRFFIPILALQVFFLFVMTLTACRKAQIAAIGVIFFTLVFYLSNEWRLFSRKKKTIVLCVLGALALFLAFVLLPWYLQSKSFGKMALLFTKKGVRARLLLYREALDVWKQHPAFGVGIMGIKLFTSKHQYSHSAYAELLSCFGLVGTLIFMIPMLLLGIRLIKKAVSCRDITLRYDYQMLFGMYLIELFLGIGQIWFYDYMHMILLLFIDIRLQQLDGPSASDGRFPRKVRTFLHLLKRPRSLIRPMAENGLFNWLPDKPYLKMLFRAEVGYPLNLEAPKTFNEKLQWMKLYDRNPLYTVMVDKHAVKQYVSEKIGNAYVIPELGCWDHAEDIEFDVLPDQFVLKVTHDSGGIVICKDKASLDRKAAVNLLSRCLNTSMYKRYREWPYKDVPRKIICEKYMVDESGEELKDYKVLCFHGEPELVEVHRGRMAGRHTQDIYDTDWNLTDFEQVGFPRAGIKMEKPVFADEMFALSRILAKGIPQVRVDWYFSENHLYFGEITFFDGSGLAPFVGNQDQILGDKILLPNCSRQ